MSKLQVIIPLLLSFFFGWVGVPETIKTGPKTGIGKSQGA